MKRPSEEAKEIKREIRPYIDLKAGDWGALTAMAYGNTQASSFVLLIHRQVYVGSIIADFQGLPYPSGDRGFKISGFFGWIQGYARQYLKTYHPSEGDTPISDQKLVDRSKKSLYGKLGWMQFNNCPLPTGEALFLAWEKLEPGMASPFTQAARENLAALIERVRLQGRPEVRRTPQGFKHIIPEA